MVSQGLKRAVFGAALIALFITWYAQPYPIEDPIWSNMLGQWIVQHLQIPHQDYWTWTARGQSWTPQEWGFEVLLYLLNRFLGFPGVAVLMALVSGATWWGLGELLEHQNVAIPRGIAFLVACFSIPWDQIRAETFSYGLFVVFLWQVERFHEDERWTHLVWLLPWMLLWVNLHGSFVLGVFLLLWAGIAEFVPAFDLGWMRHQPHREHAKPLLWTTLGLILVSLVNPQTWHLYGFALWLSLESHVSQYILEWQPPVATQWYTADILLLFGLWTILRLNRKESTAFVKMMWFLGAFVMFLHSLRFGSYLLIVLPWALAPQAEYVWQSWLRWQSIRQPFALALAIGMTGLTLRSGFILRGTLQSHAISSLYPRAMIMVEKLHKEHPTWHLWNGYAIGGSLETVGVPVSVDGRTELYLSNGVMKNLMLVEMAKPGTRHVLRVDDVNYVCVRHTDPLTELLQIDSSWQRVYLGKHYDVFVRKEALNA